MMASTSTLEFNKWSDWNSSVDTNNHLPLFSDLGYMENLLEFTIEDVSAAMNQSHLFNGNTQQQQLKATQQQQQLDMLDLQPVTDFLDQISGQSHESIDWMTHSSQSCSHDGLSQTSPALSLLLTSPSSNLELSPPSISYGSSISPQTPALNILETTGSSSGVTKKQQKKTSSYPRPFVPQLPANAFRRVVMPDMQVVYQCTAPECGKSFTRKAENAKSHWMQHAQIAPFICDFCVMGFRRMADLKRHCKKNHTGKKLSASNAESDNSSFSLSPSAGAIHYDNECC